MEIAGLADASDGRQGAEVDANANGNVVFLGERCDLSHLVGITDVAGVQADAADAAANRLKRKLVMEVNVGDDGDGRSAADSCQRLCGVHIRDGATDYVTPCRGNLIDLQNRRLDVAGVRLGHGLDGDFSIAANRDFTYMDLVRYTPVRHGETPATTHEMSLDSVSQYHRGP